MNCLSNLIEMIFGAQQNLSNKHISFFLFLLEMHKYLLKIEFLKMLVCIKLKCNKNFKNESSNKLIM